MKYWLCLLLLQTGMAIAQTVPATETPIIREIVFSGNNTTQPKVMLREMSVRVGDVAEASSIEHSRQAIQDLGLFKSVEVQQEPLPDGVRLVYVVREKFFLLPYPRLGANVDGQYNYGAELRWNNIDGLNQNLRLLVSQGSDNRAGYGKQTSYLAGYDIPFIADTKENLSLLFSHSSTPRTNDLTGDGYIEKQTSAQALVTRTISTTAASQGWTVGGGLLYLNEDRYGLGAAPPYGHAMAMVGTLEYRDLHLEIYSEEGTLFDFRQETAVKGLASDYGYTQLRADFERYIPVGSVQYQTLEFDGSMGARFSGPQDVQAFALGGGAGLRGYRRYTLEGNSFYYAAAIYQRPIGWDWLRLMTGLEVGNVAADANTELFKHVSADLLLGLRLRILWFINLEFEAGWAVPLDGSSSGRFFGGRHN